jgi:RNA polymerase sigma factor (sigma-70 family)
LNTNISYNEKDLLFRIADGDELAFTILFKKYAPLLEKNIQRVIADPYGVSEVLQETFIRIWLTREKLTRILNARAYFNTMALHECFDYIRKQQKDLIVRNATDRNPATVLGPQDELAAKETAEIIQKAILELPAQRKKIYEMSRNLGMNSKQIAQELGVSSDYVRQAISVARQHIKEKLLQAGKVLSVLSGLF